MSYVFDYIVRYFILLCAASVLYVISIQRFKANKKMSICMILIVSATLFLSVANIIEDFSKDNCLAVLATITSWIGYIVRPALVFLFIILCGTKLTKKQTILTAIPLVINLIIISGTFIPGIKFTFLHFVKCWAGIISGLLIRGILKTNV